MADRKLPPLVRQVNRVSRRLLVQALANRLAWCWTAALAVATLWLLAEPLIWEQAPTWLRWAVAGGAAGAATLLAGALTLWNAPSSVTAALEMDEKFGLKERVTTSLTLAPGQEATPAGQALLADVNQRVEQLDVSSGFPFRLAWNAALVPAGVLLLALVAAFYEPPRSTATTDPKGDEARKPLNAKEIDKKLAELKRKAPEKRSDKAPKSEELKRIEAELEKIANRPRENTEQLKERIKEMTALQDQIKDREKSLADKSRSVKQQLQQLDKMAGKTAQEGPAKEMQKALSEGKFDKAMEEIERLSKKLKNDELSDKEKEQLKKQLQDIEKKLERLAQQQEKQEKLKQLEREGKLDPETLKRELEKIKKDNKQLEQLKEMAKKLGQCQQCLKQGDQQGASDQLEQAGQVLNEMDMSEQELQDLRDQLSRLQDAKDSC